MSAMCLRYMSPVYDIIFYIISIKQIRNRSKGKTASLLLYKEMMRKDVDMFCLRYAYIKICSRFFFTKMYVVSSKGLRTKIVKLK